VWAIPLKLTAISIEDFWPITLHNNQTQLFRDALCRIERENSGVTKWSETFLKSRENVFLNDILIWKRTLPYLQQMHPELLEEALHRTPERLALAASEWKLFVDKYFIAWNQTVPDWPLYVEIQETLGIYGQSSFECAFRRIKRNAQKRLNVFFYRLYSAISKMWTKMRSATIQAST
jgi:hypothetical protein